MFPVRHFSMLFAWLALSNLASAQSDQSPTAQDTVLQQLQQGLSRWCNGDPMGYANLFAEELTFVSEDSAVVIRGMADLQEHFRPLIGKTKSNPAFCEPKGLTIRQVDNHVFVTYYLDYPQRIFQATEVYGKMGNEWKIIHSHWSEVPKGIDASSSNLLNNPFVTLPIALFVGVLAGRFLVGRKKKVAG